MRSKHILYEPRAYWDVGTFLPDLVPTDTNQAQREIVFNKDSFRNISRNPVKLTKFNLCMVGAASQDGLNLLSQASFFLSAPNRQSWSFTPLEASTWKQDQKGDPSMLYSATPRVSGLMGTSRWMFDHHFELPRDGVIQFDVSGVGYTTTESPNNVDGGAYYTFAFFEDGGRFGGNARIRQREPIRECPVALALGQTAGIWPAGNLPTFPYGYVPKGAGPFSSKTWADEGQFKTKTWRENEITRGQMGSRVAGFQVLVDQIETDDRVAANPLLPVPAPMATRLITRCRTTAGPTGEWWWREGAPLALVSPDAGPALTYTLPRPITLEPGDQLQLECLTPRVYLPEAEQFRLFPFNIGVSFTGFAEVSG